MAWWIVCNSKRVGTHSAKRRWTVNDVGLVVPRNKFAVTLQRLLLGTLWNVILVSGITNEIPRIVRVTYDQQKWKQGQIAKTSAAGTNCRRWKRENMYWENNLVSYRIWNYQRKRKSTSGVSEVEILICWIPWFLLEAMIFFQANETNINDLRFRTGI